MKSPLLFATMLLCSSLANAATITAAQAKDHEGETATVCGTVASERTATSGKGEPTFINLDAPYPKQIFTILVWGDDRSKVGILPQNGAHVCATGLIQDYRGVPEIVVRSSGQFEQVELSAKRVGLRSGTINRQSSRCRLHTSRLAWRSAYNTCSSCRRCTDRFRYRSRNTSRRTKSWQSLGLPLAA
jgi:hypothetical protein